MGILNTTPDSFSDGGRFDSVEAALQHAMRMVDEGADIIDVGGESTRPGAAAVETAAELERVIPVIEAIRRRSDIAISIDTSKVEVMRAAVAAGADMVNDVNALRAEGAVEACGDLQVPVCLMHMQGEPRTMQDHPEYADVVGDVADFLRRRAEACISAGIQRDRIVLDPGFGFGKTLEHNLRLLRELETIAGLGCPVLVGLSRKRMIGALLDRPVNERVTGSVAAAVIAWQHGARWFRVHDVAPTRDALIICEAVNRA
jgi:dihydropteroate synthase